MSESRLNILTIKLPEKYCISSGIVVDASSPFGSELFGVWPLNGSWNGVLPEITQEGENNFKNRKCVLRLKLPRAPLTPAGLISVPTFTGTKGDVSSASIGAPAGRIDDLIFTGNQQAVGGSSAGTPQGSISPLSFEGSPVDTSKEFIGCPKGSVTAPVFEGKMQGAHTHAFLGIQPNIGGMCVAGCHGNHVAFEPPVGQIGVSEIETPQGIVTTPVFIGEPLPKHAHIVLPAGTVSQPSFIGTQLPEHSHFITPAGIITKPLFVGEESSPHSHAFVPAGS